MTKNPITDNVTLKDANPDLHIGMRVEGGPEFGVDTKITSVSADNKSFTISKELSNMVPEDTNLIFISETRFTLTATIEGDGDVRFTVGGDGLESSAFEFYRGL